MDLIFTKFVLNYEQFLRLSDKKLWNTSLICPKWLPAPLPNILSSTPSIKIALTFYASNIAICAYIFPTNVGIHTMKVVFVTALCSLFLVSCLLSLPACPLPYTCHLLFVTCVLPLLLALSLATCHFPLAWNHIPLTASLFCYLLPLWLHQ